MIKQTSEERRLLTVKQWTKEHNWPPEGGLRHLIFHSENNGFDEAFIRVGRRVLIDEPKFFECVDRAARVNQF